MNEPETPRTRILHAAATIASESGYIGTTISKIRKQTGLPSSSIYWYFGDKDRLMAEVIDHSYAEWAALLPQDDALPTPPTPLDEVLRTLLRATTLAHQETPDFLRIGHMLLLEGRDVESVARQRYIAIRATMVTRTAAWLERFLPSTAPETLPHDLARLIVASQDGLFLARQRGETWDSERIIDVIVATAEAAVTDLPAA